MVGSVVLIDWQSIEGDPCKGSWNITAQEGAGGEGCGH